MPIHERMRLWSGVVQPLMNTRWCVYVLLAVPYVAMSVWTRLGFRLIGDEGRFHLKAIERFATLGAYAAVVDYEAASTPLPYILWAGLGNIVGFEIWKLRLLSVVITYLTAILFYRLAKRYGLPFPFLSSLILVFMPYIFFHGFTVYTTNFGLLFGVATLHFYLPDRVGTVGLLIGVMLATLAIYSRQYYLVLPAGMMLYELYSINWRSQWDFATLMRYFWRSLVLALPVIAFFPLVVLWGGLTPPQFQTDHFVHPVFQHFNFLPVFVGFYFLPQLFSTPTIELLQKRRLTLLVLVALLPVLWGFPLVYSEGFGGIGTTTGIIAHGIHIVGEHLGGPVATVAISGLWLVGMVIILGAVTSQSRSRADTKLMALVLAFLLLLTLTPYVSERYYVLTVPFFILIFHRKFDHRGLLIAWIVVQAAVTMVFSYWQIAMKTFW